jgi:hypothetical protein
VFGSPWVEFAIRITPGSTPAAPIDSPRLRTGGNFALLSSEDGQDLPLLAPALKSSRALASSAETSSNTAGEILRSKDFGFREPERVRFDATFSNHRTVVFEDASHFLQEAVGDRIVDAYRRIRWHSTFERL